VLAPWHQWQSVNLLTDDEVIAPIKMKALEMMAA